MRLLQHYEDHEFCLEQAARLVEGPVRAVALDYDVVELLRPHLRFELRRGLTLPHAVLAIHRGPRGKRLEAGFERFRLEAGRRAIRLVKFQSPCCQGSALDEFWVVAAADYRELYRTIRSLERHSQPAPAPLMHRADQQRLWDNTIGFLGRGQAALRRYGVARKRGVLLAGEPGNGKTMACRWLMGLCNLRGFRWKCVTPTDYQDAKSSGEIAELFALDRPGIVLFDDFDVALQPRNEVGPNVDRTTFLTQLDGVYPRDGLVFLFTSNARPIELDAAFRRPGRIDLMLSLPRPSAELRRRLVESSWHVELRAAIDIEQVVTATEGLSFAEIEELKKLLVLGFLDRGAWDWPAAWAAFRAERGSGERPQPIGFHPADSGTANGRELTRMNGFA